MYLNQISLDAHLIAKGYIQHILDNVNLSDVLEWADEYGVYIPPLNEGDVMDNIRNYDLQGDE